MPVRILLVEDDPVSRDLLAALLRARNYEVDEAADGFGALRLAQDLVYDLIFIDYHLPEMDGYALARLMRTLGEKSNVNLNMVAITADSHGLATRRGADCVFDRILSKPIDPEALYQFCDDFLVEPADQVLDLDGFLAQPLETEARGAAAVLWRVRGLPERPNAAVFPTPTDEERASLEFCFRIVPPAQADCLVLLRQAGLCEIEALRASGAESLQPLFVLEAGHADIGDALFSVGDGESWTAAAAAIVGFRERREELRNEIRAARDLDTRFAAYLHVADKPLRLRRDRLGRTSVPYTAGFAAADLIAAVKRLAGSGLVVARVSHSHDGPEREIAVHLTDAGLRHVAPSAKQQKIIGA